jgi:hypothetical protein
VHPPPLIVHDVRSIVHPVPRIVDDARNIVRNHIKSVNFNGLSKNRLFRRVAIKIPAFQPQKSGTYVKRFRIYLPAAFLALALAVRVAAAC